MGLQFGDPVENWSLHALSVLDVLMFKSLLEVVAMVFGGVDGEKKMREILGIVGLRWEMWVDVWIERRGRWKEVGFVRGKGRLKRVVAGWEISGRVVMKKKFKWNPTYAFRHYRAAAEALSLPRQRCLWLGGFGFVDSRAAAEVYGLPRQNPLWLG